MNTAPASSNDPPPRRPWWRVLLRYLGMAAAVYLGVVILLLVLENSMVYHPTPASRDWMRPPRPGVHDVEMTTADGTKIHGWWYPRDKAAGALLYLHGNAGNLSHRGAIMVQLSDALGESVLLIDYPGYGKSEGSPSEAGCYAAGEAAYAWLSQTKNIPPEQILLYGKSMGGGVAVDLASRHKHRALILVNTFTSMPDVGQHHYPWLPVRWLMRNRFDSLAKIKECKRPVFMAHGTADRVIPYVLGERLFAAVEAEKKFCPMPGVDHNDPLPEAFFTQLREFLRKVPAPSG